MISAALQKRRGREIYVNGRTSLPGRPGRRAGAITSFQSVERAENDEIGEGG
jgi:hypothetical protein